MNPFLSIQFLSCLFLYTISVQGIMVKFGTKDGPIEPPTPEPLPTPQPYRVPAPVWESRSDDGPDPNAQWRPQFFFPQRRYTQVIYKMASSTPVPENNAQRFVNAYIPQRPNSAQPLPQFNRHSQFLGTQNLPGFGIRYFLPAYVTDLLARKEEKKQEDAKHNEIQTNDINDSHKDSNSDYMWKQEKDSSRRFLNNAEGAVKPVYQWPVYVSPRH